MSVLYRPARPMQEKKLFFEKNLTAYNEQGKYKQRLSKGIDMNPHQMAEAYGDHLDSLVPRWYEKAEEYEPGTDSEPPRATKHPPTGIPILDISSRKIKKNMLPLKAYQIKRLRRQALQTPITD